jgi:cytochrome c
MKRTLLAVMLVLAAALAIAEGDAKRGAQLFGQCLACHSTTAGEHLTGPSLAHVWNHKAASSEGFQRYSDALKKSGIVWNDATLDQWLASPETLVPGTSMTFQGIKDAKLRQDVIAYLRAVSEDKAPPSQARGMMSNRRPDLKAAPPEGQVIGVKHCGDAYTIQTADGQSQKIWEFNLRLKTDSSKLGPAPGKPVVVGAGMQGDRASLVFASPGEISAFIKTSCD